MFVVVRFVKYNTSIASVKFAQTLLLWHDKSNTLSFRQNQSQRTRSDMKGLKYTRPRYEHPRHSPNCVASLSTIKKECYSFISFCYIQIKNYIDIFLIWHGICFTKTTPLAEVIFKYGSSNIFQPLLPRPAQGRFDAWSSERVRSWNLTGEVRKPEVDSPGAWCCVVFFICLKTWKICWVYVDLFVSIWFDVTWFGW